MKRYCVRVNTDEERDRILKVAEKWDIKWIYGQKATEFTPEAPCLLFLNHLYYFTYDFELCVNDALEITPEQFIMFLKWKGAKKQFKESLNK